MIVIVIVFAIAVIVGSRDGRRKIGPNGACGMI
jgi:hypothetical protein